MQKHAFPVLEQKKKLVILLVDKMKHSKTVLIASTKGLPSSQFNQIKKNFRGTADIRVLKKSIVNRAIKETEKGAIQHLKSHIGADVAVFFSDLDAFELSGLLSDNQTPAKAREGDLLLEDIHIEPGPTDLMPGPAISELSGVGLKVAVENGKLAIKQGATIAKKGDKVNAKVVSVLGKLNILPMKVGFTPIAAYDSVSDKVYTGIIIDKPKTLEELKELIKKSLGFAINIGYITDKTISYFISKAALEAKALERVMNKDQNHKEEKQ